MTVLLSSTSSYYNSPRSVQIADTLYDGVRSVDRREIIDNDGIRKTVNYLDCKESEIVSYVVDNKVTRSSEYFTEPLTITLGNKTYSGVVSKTVIPGKYSTYSINKPNGFFNTVRVRKNGSIVDMDALQRALMIRKLKQPFVKLAAVIR